jgi:hypothetical protein
MTDTPKPPPAEVHRLREILAEGLAPKPTPAVEPSALPERLRKFRLDVEVAGSRMPWDKDWSLDRLMCAAADAIASLTAERDALKAERDEAREAVGFYLKRATDAQILQRAAEADVRRLRAALKDYLDSPDP